MNSDIAPHVPEGRSALGTAEVAKLKGGLVVVGTGIGVGHISTEARRWIEIADKVLYCVADVATERLIQRINPAAETLYVFYGNDKRRSITYREMVERMLAFVREGLDVCAVFYGHPGIFCYPPHEAIRIARKEGFRARMLPAISSLDCLFADLGVDPALGCQIFEATDLVIRKRPIDTSATVIVWQIACVGDLGFNFNGYDCRNLPVLVRLLQDQYGEDYEVTIYEAAQYPLCEPVIKIVPLSEVVKSHITAISTMYIPPKGERPVHEDALRSLGLWEVVKGKVRARTPSPASIGIARPNGRG